MDEEIWLKTDKAVMSFPISTGSASNVGQFIRLLAAQGLPDLEGAHFTQIHLATADGKPIRGGKPISELQQGNSDTNPILIKVRRAASSVSLVEGASHDQGSRNEDQGSRNMHGPMPEKRVRLNERLSVKKELPIGMESFRHVIEGGYTYVDKSLIIADFLEDAGYVSLILRPRRFGKSLNLSILRYFFEIPDDVRPRSSGSKSRRDLFAGLKIEERRELFDKHFAKYPVIYISLKDLKSKNWDNMLNDTRDLIADVFKSQSHIWKELADDEKDHFKKIAEADSSYPYLATSLKKLSFYLRNTYNERCIVLIDEYDTPLDSAYNNGFYKDAADFFSRLFSPLLKGNDDNVFKAMLVGVLRIAKSGFLSGLNNLSVYPMYAKEFSDKFGFTADEVKFLLEKYEHSPMEDVQKWYNGYHTGIGIRLFNPWSIINFCKNKETRTYWIETGGTSTIKNLIWKSGWMFKNEVMKLFSGQNLRIDLQEDVGYEDLKPMNLWSLLYYAGYVTINSEGYLAIPNSEVQSQWSGWFLSYLNDDTQRVVPCLDFLLAGAVEEFAKTFPDLLMATLSYYDVGGTNQNDKAENFYHAFTLGLLFAARERGYKITSNRESGLGRFDVVILPEQWNKNSIGVILEFKVQHGGAPLEKAAMAALEQIESRQYRLGIQVDKVVEMGIAFEGKIAVVKGRVLKKTNGKWIVL